jgi:peptide/nickel transport system ATP-binding protein
MLRDVTERPAPANTPLVRIRNAALEFKIGARWGRKRVLRALDDVSLDVIPGEILALVGESGSGKTTLGKAMLGLCRLSSGSIDVAPSDGSRQSGNDAHDLQMVFQDPLSSFNPRFTIGSSATLPLRLHLSVPEAEIRSRVRDLLVKVGLNSGFVDRYPHEMSGGQLQRAAIARALSVSPRLIVADEAVSKLDVSVRAQILNLIKSLNRAERIAFVFITHDLVLAQYLADRVAVMYFGRIVEVGPVDEVMSRPRHPYTAMLLAARVGNATSTDEATPNVDGCNFATRCSRTKEQCISSRPAVSACGHGHEVRCFDPLTQATTRVP